MTVRVVSGDCLDTLRTLPDGAAQCCVTSPPYYGLRDYGMAGQIGLEETPDAYIARLVEVFREVRRVLRDDGVLFLNIGDSYAGGGGISQPHRDTNGGFSGSPGTRTRGYAKAGGGFARPATTGSGIKPKDLLMIPAQVALALRADGWFLRSDIIWAKPNPMPESVTDRPTSAHEHVFLLTKSARYFYDAAAIAEASEGRELFGNSRSKGHCEQRQDNARQDMTPTTHRNARNVWTIATQPYSGAHFATMPPDLAERCIKAGSKPGDTILDPFGGAGTTGLVADRLNRNAILCELNPAYATLARERLTDDAPLLAVVA